jgi:hypothetical protein
MGDDVVMPNDTIAAEDSITIDEAIEEVMFGEEF